MELVHDPLGLELLLRGTIRDKRVQFEDYGQRDVGSIAALGARFRINSLAFPGMTGDRNTLRIGVVTFTRGDSRGVGGRRSAGRRSAVRRVGGAGRSAGQTGRRVGL